MKLDTYNVIKILAWVLLVVGLAFLTNNWLGWGNDLPLPFPNTYVKSSVPIIISFGLFLINLLFWDKITRRGIQLNQEKWRFHWVAIATYRGKADPTFLSVKKAQDILDDWGCSNANSLLSLIEEYQKGEINIAFDQTRVLWLAELGVAANWLTKEELHKLSENACSKIQSSYLNWSLFADDVMKGRENWFTVKQLVMPYQEKEAAKSAREYAANLWPNTSWM